MTKDRQCSHMASLAQLWGHIQRCPLDRSQHSGLTRHHPSKPEVTQLDGIVGTDKHVLWLHVSVNDLLGMQVVQRMGQLPCDVPHFLLGKSLVILEDLEELAIANSVTTTKSVVGFEGVEEPDDVRVVEALEDAYLEAQVLKILVGLPPLRNELQRDDLPRKASPPLEDLPETALADQVEHVVPLHRGRP
eukprot:CAMPEP_0180474770 /NCGR_PEP_ID=MMETSP1036_2-20121128/30847_1 /TAXON_ID=632150 /ORGANISM="Azadinium spinosum, Strain 3D9" /LENGTH=189 /DNA_ID=CAMNT_0022482095 /DNA_START=215 /DNA_END=783 /DNA_ORIENTATION=-